MLRSGVQLPSAPMFAIPVRFPPPCVKMRTMRLDLSPLEKSLTRLETSVSYWRSDAARADAGLRREFSQSVIQGFEYTYGATVAMIDRALREHSREQDSILKMDFADRMRAAADLGIVRDWRDFLEPPPQAQHNLPRLQQKSCGKCPRLGGRFHFGRPLCAGASSPILLTPKLRKLCGRLKADSPVVPKRRLGMRTAKRRFAPPVNPPIPDSRRWGDSPRRIKNRPPPNSMF